MFPKDAELHVTFLYSFVRAHRASESLLACVRHVMVPELPFAGESFTADRAHDHLPSVDQMLQI